MPAWLIEYRTTLVLSALIVVPLVLTLVWRIEDTRTLRWAHVYEISTPFHQQALWAAEEFERLTEGRYRIRVYPASALGNEASINEALSLRSIDIIYTGAAFGANSYPPIALSDFPYAIDDFEHWKAYRDSDLFREIAAGYGNATGTRIGGLSYYGFRHVTANKPVLHPSDMRNLKIRVPNSPIYLIFPEAVGANATPMPFGEVYLALQQGVVDAEENPLTTIRAKRFYEVQTHISLTGHIMPALLTLVPEDLLGSLEQEDAQALLEVLWRSADRASHEIAANEPGLIEWFREKGIVVSEVDRAAFRAAIEEEFRDREYPFDPIYLERLRELAAQ
jgi:tripartite ATP-independent transporter DctP family solute receptor